MSSPPPSHPTTTTVRLPLLPRSSPRGSTISSRRGHSHTSGGGGGASSQPAAPAPAPRAYGFQRPYSRSSGEAATSAPPAALKEDAELLRLKALLQRQNDRLGARSGRVPPAPASLAVAEPYTMLTADGTVKRLESPAHRRAGAGPTPHPPAPSAGDAPKNTPAEEEEEEKQSPPSVAPHPGTGAAFTSPAEPGGIGGSESLEDDPEVQALMHGAGGSPASAGGDKDGERAFSESQFTTVTFSSTETKRPLAIRTQKEFHGMPLRVMDRSQASMTLGRMSMASSSVQHITDGAIAIMEMLEDRPDVVLPSPLEVGVTRTGDVLSAKHILKMDLQDALIGRRGSTGIISGAPYFRVVPKLNVGGVAQANMSAITTILNELHRAHVDGPVVWVNLREEPVVYINNSAHIVRTRQDPLVPVTIPNVTGRGIEVVEAKLKQEVLKEASENGGNVSVHIEGLDNMWEDQWECADAKNTFTMAEVFQHVTRTIGGQMRVQYFRRPITANVGPQPEDFDFVYDISLEQPTSLMIFNCQTGRGRTAAMMMIANIVRFYQYCHDDVNANVRLMKGNSRGLVFRTIQKIVSVLPNGPLHEKRLSILMDIADKGYSLSDHIREAFTMDNDNYEVAAMRLHQYALFLTFSYYCEQRLWLKATDLPFSEWLNRNPEVKLLINSVKDKMVDQLKEERILAPAAKGKEASAARAVRQRSGNVLSAGRILCSMPKTSDASILELRQLAPDVPIFSCGRLGSDERRDLVREIREAFPQHQRVHWLSLRAEPMVQINGVNYTLSDFNAPVHDSEVGMTMHISLEEMEKMEERLKADVEAEAAANKGEIILHRITEDGARETMFVKVEDVKTPHTTMERFISECGIAYHRVPIPFSGQILPSDIDPLLRYFASGTCGPHDIIVINDAEGTVRSTIALNIHTLYRASRLADLRELTSVKALTDVLVSGESGALIPSAYMASTVPVDKDDVPDEHVEILLASTIVQILAAGTLLRTVDAAVSLGGRGPKWNLLHAIDFFKRSAATKAGGERAATLLHALHVLRCYLLVLLAAIYVDDQGDVSDDMPFSSWIESRSELSFIIDNVEARGEKALKYVPSANLMVADLSRRCGDVLTANFCLKADHFPGAIKKGLRPELCGAPNLRKVNYVNVYGVAIPTRMGIENVLSMLGASGEPLQTYPDQRNDPEISMGYPCPHAMSPDFDPSALAAPLPGMVVWVNLREEPLLYVGDRPFVFRDLSAPYVNVEMTGIQTDKIEYVEMKLKDDVLKEAQQYDGKFLVHDEGKPGELVGSWEVANAETVKTMREVFEEQSQRGVRCQMVRLPVTDEQSPAFSDFDALVDVLLPSVVKSVGLDDPVSFVFNCQMGRGRTTTGMVVCCLIIGCVVPSYYDQLHRLYNPLFPPGASELSKGEYSIVTQLKRVLLTGRQAKDKTDLVLNACDKMQNLRTAIEDLAVTASSPDSTEAGRARAHHAGVHYLVRYFNLIAFTAYLDEEYDAAARRVRRTFAQWMGTHPELTTLSASAALHA